MRPVLLNPIVQPLQTDCHMIIGLRQGLAAKQSNHQPHKTCSPQSTRVQGCQLSRPCDKNRKKKSCSTPLPLRTTKLDVGLHCPADERLKGRSITSPACSLMLCRLSLTSTDSQCSRLLAHPNRLIWGSAGVQTCCSARLPHTARLCFAARLCSADDTLQHKAQPTLLGYHTHPAAQTQNLQPVLGRLHIVAVLLPSGAANIYLTIQPRVAALLWLAQQPSNPDRTKRSRDHLCHATGTTVCACKQQPYTPL